jgi:4-hydroxyphenylpyruvate dioxygenase-like putative hemolysin
MVFKSSYTKDDTDKISEFVTKHGDGVKDVCFRVSDTKKAYEYLKNKKAKFVS